MALTNAVNRVEATGDDSTDTFAFNKLLYDSSHLTVYADGVLVASGYSVTGVPGTSTSIVFDDPPALDVNLVFLREVPLTQLSVYAVGGAFPAATTEKNLDLLMMANQQFDERLDRSLTIPVDESAADYPMVLPDAATRSSMYFGFDADGLPTALSAPTDTALTTAFTETLLDDADADDARATLEAAERGWGLENVILKATVAASALTVELKTSADTDPTALDYINIRFPSTLVTTRALAVTGLVTAAISVTASSGSTLGTVSGVASRIYVGVASDGGTLRLFLYNPYLATTGRTLNLVDTSAYSSTAEGGAGAADTAQVLYSTTAFTSAHIRIIGYVESTQATAGAWATTPSKTVLLPNRAPAPVVPDGYYLEGTWTPSTGGTTTYASQSGTYTRIGRKVTVCGLLVITLIGTGSTTTVSGLPFTVGTLSGVGAVDFLNLSNNATTVSAVATAGTATVILKSIAAAGTDMGANAIIGDTTELRFTVTYFV